MGPFTEHWTKLAELVADTRLGELDSAPLTEAGVPRRAPSRHPRLPRSHGLPRKCGGAWWSRAGESLMEELAGPCCHATRALRQPARIHLAGRGGGFEMERWRTSTKLAFPRTMFRCLRPELVSIGVPLVVGLFVAASSLCGSAKPGDAPDHQRVGSLLVLVRVPT